MRLKILGNLVKTAHFKHYLWRPEVCEKPTRRRVPPVDMDEAKGGERCGVWASHSPLAARNNVKKKRGFNLIFLFYQPCYEKKFDLTYTLTLRNIKYGIVQHLWSRCK